jgi:hypothetical protein
MGGQAVLIAALLASVLGAADGTERYLAPIAVDGVQGAHQSRWYSELAVHTTGTLDMALELCVVMCPPWYNFRAGDPEIFRLGLGQPGRIFRFRQESGTAQFGTLVRDSARPTAPGAWLPLVREDEFRPEIHLLPVVGGWGRRIMIRVYSMSDATELPVRVRIVGIWPRTEEVVDLWLTRPRGPYPQYAEYLIPPDATERDHHFHVEVISLNPEVNIWAFASVTSPESEIAVVLPAEERRSPAEREP